ncbi:MAG: hypothetical protein MOB07_30580, partial [Acidobacteria bacterium]|nr:hypothetical protein [Acidobacteriota bacterium]
GCSKNETPAAMMMEGLRKSRRLFRFLLVEMAAHNSVLFVDPANVSAGDYALPDMVKRVDPEVGGRQIEATDVIVYKYGHLRWNRDRQ